MSFLSPHETKPGKELGVTCFAHESLRTFEGGADAFPDGDTADALVLTQGEFHVEERQSAEDQHHQVRDQKRTYNTETQRVSH